MVELKNFEFRMDVRLEAIYDDWKESERVDEWFDLMVYARGCILSSKSKV